MVSQVHKVEDSFWFLNANKRLEQVFGIYRSMRGGNLNFDCLDLRDCLADSSLIQCIYSELPEWSEASRRLNSGADRKNTTYWKGDTKVAGVDIPKYWMEGRKKELKYLSESEIFSQDELNIDEIMKDEPGVNMLRLYCRATLVGLLAGDRPQYNLLSADLNDDEYDEVDDFTLSD